jgi:hypothetical protein
MSSITYTLEVLEFQPPEDASEFTSTYKHVGYMDARFRTKMDAASYYNRHNPHMRSLNAHNTWASDWDPKTQRAYVVRVDIDVESTVPPFDPADAGEVDANSYSAAYLK